MDLNEFKKYHLIELQKVINQLSHHSFLIKLVSIFLIFAVLVLTDKVTNPFFSLIALLPPLIFWYLDAVCVKKERLYRELYDEVRIDIQAQKNIVPIFSMDTSKFESHDNCKLSHVILTDALAIFYGLIFLAVVIVIGVVLIISTLA